MEQMIDLKDLLKHEIMDLHSAEQQIIDALPSMIEKAKNDKLKNALKDHLKITENQKKRLEELKQMLGEGETSESNERPGLFSRLFGGEEKCKGMEGLIAEGEKLMKADMSPEASDAAIIAAAQKIEHYEISGYGTARAYARELNLGEVANKLEQTLNEEYAADDLLTELAVGKLNVEAEFATSLEGSNSRRAQRQGKSTGRSNGSSTSSKNNGRGISKSRSNGNGSTAGRGSASKSASKSSSKSSIKGHTSLRKTSAANGRSTASKSVSKSKGGSNSKSTGSNRSSSKTSGRNKSSRGR